MASSLSRTFACIRSKVRIQAADIVSHIPPGARSTISRQDASISTAADLPNISRETTSRDMFFSNENSFKALQGPRPDPDPVAAHGIRMRFEVCGAFRHLA